MAILQFPEGLRSPNRPLARIAHNSRQQRWLHQVWAKRMNNKPLSQSVKMAVIMGIFLPLAETVRRDPNALSIEAYLDKLDQSDSHLLGTPVSWDDDMRHDAYLASKTSSKPDQDMSEIAKWRTLLNMGSSRKANMTFGDAGIVQFVIREEDLAQQDFSKVKGGLASS